MPWKYIGPRRDGEKPGERMAGGIPAQDLTDEEAAPFLLLLQQSSAFELDKSKPKRGQESES